MKHANHASHAPRTSASAQDGGPSHPADGGHAYAMLAAMTALMFAVMYGLMYAMVDQFRHIYHSLNQVYMAGLMTGAMVLLELLVMRSMYRHRGRNAVVITLCVLMLVVSWFGLREQWGIGNRQFLRSMIPHHSGALLMCGQAAITDARIRTLCDEIEASQKREIELMERLLATPASASASDAP